MRFETFEPMSQEPLGVGDDKEAFVDPKNAERVISVIKEKEGVEKDTPNALKGAFYLTKIVHMLLPDNVPDIYQAGESADGQQSFDRERISHTSGHTLLQTERLAGRNTDEAAKQIVKEMDGEMSELDMKLADIGFAFSIDSNVGNYSQDEKGNVHYLETFMPWRVETVNLQTKPELLFDEGDLRKAIEQLPSEEQRTTCEKYLERLLELFEEEKARQKDTPGASEEEFKTYEALFETFEAKHDVDALYAIKTADEALGSKERMSAKSDLIPVLNFLNTLEHEKKVTSEQYLVLYEKYKRLDRAVGMINSGLVDHNR